MASYATSKKQSLLSGGFLEVASGRDHARGYEEITATVFIYFFTAPSTVNTIEMESLFSESSLV
jgi:hypothetical protein